MLGNMEDRLHVMNKSTWIYSTAALIVVWLASIVILSTSLIFANTFAAFGGDLPSWTVWIMSLSKNHVPMLFAMISTGVIGYLLLRGSVYTLRVTLVIVLLAAIYVSIALFSFAMPVAMCGDYWPEWPPDAESNRLSITSLESGC